MYTYKVKNIISIYDADTVHVQVDLGFNIEFAIKVRLAWINAPEVRGDEREFGLISRDWLRERLLSAELEKRDIFIKTIKDKTEKYGRYLGEIYIDSLDTRSINDELVFEGFAEYVDY